MTFLTDDFLLQSDVARELYHDYAKPQPIYDFHSHLPAAQIAENRRFENLSEVWLAGDHYKWRAMRWNGVPERLITGEASPWEKFLAYAKTVPRTLRNPLYHWTHLELKFYFKIDELLDEDSAESIWNQANEQLAEMPVHELLRKSRVAVACTTDDPTDDLAAHRETRKEQSCPARVYPTFRPDKALLVNHTEIWNRWIDQLSVASKTGCDSFANFLDALKQRHDSFHEVGGRLSDHGLAQCQADDCSEAEARKTYETARARLPVDPVAAGKFRSFLMHFFGELDAARGWTKQLHLGAFRDNHGGARHNLGPDMGYDSIGDFAQGPALRRYLDRLAGLGRLPKMILYNVNPNDNYLFATMAGNFQDETIPGKIQLGSAWWFLDQKDGIEAQLDVLSNLGLLSCFVGMVTDSRSFLSFPRHEYFRRILCDLIGCEVVRGELPRDLKLLGTMIADICFHNARRYLGLELP